MPHLFVFIFGTIVGSFLNVCIVRIPAYCKASKDGWSYLPHMLRERRRIRKIQTVDDRYIGRIMSFKEPVHTLFHSCAAALSLSERGLRDGSRLPLSRFLSACLGEKL